MPKKLGPVNPESNSYLPPRTRHGVGRMYNSYPGEFQAGKSYLPSEMRDSFNKESHVAVPPVAPPAGVFCLTSALSYDDGFDSSGYFNESAFPRDSNKENNFDSMKESGFRVDDEVIRTFYHLGHLLWLQQSSSTVPSPPPPPPPRLCDTCCVQTELRIADIEGMGNRIDQLVGDLYRLRQVVSDVSSDRDMQVEESQQTISRLTLEIISLKEELAQPQYLLNLDDSCYFSFVIALFILVVMNPQPYWLLSDVMHRKPKTSLFQLMELALQLHSFGRAKEAQSIAAVVLRGFVTLADDNRLDSYRNLTKFLRFLEVFSTEEMSNSLVRLYNRVLHLKQAECVDWPGGGLEHVVLRSCVLHGISGGRASALADLQRKCKSWHFNAKSEDYPVTQQISSSSSSDESNDSGRRKVPRRRGVTAEMVEQRRSQVISEWLLKLSSAR